MTKSFLVTGMHRSATSLVAGALHNYGVDMGDELLGPGAGNPNGHFEDLRVVRANDSALFAAGGTWSEVPDNIGTVNSDTIKAITSNREGFWGMKDPRLSLTLPQWLPHMGDDPIVVAMFRHPTKIRESLERRVPFSGDGHRLALEYQNRLLSSIKEWIES